MQVPNSAIGVVFSLDVVEHGFRAIEHFMLRTDPKRLILCVLSSGDVLLPKTEIVKSRYDYCVAASGPDSAIQYIRQIFEQLDIPELAPKHRRFVEQAHLKQLGLSDDGHIDAQGRFVTNEWNPRDHNKCKKAGWAYAPRCINQDLYRPSPTQLAELEELRRPRR